jgi:hypothetical protein
MRQELMWALIICIRNWCVRWVYGSGASACTENKRQELMSKVNARMKFEKVPSKHAEHIRQELIWLWAYASVSYVYAQHKRKNSKFKKSLQNMLSLHIRKWYMQWAYTSGYDAWTEHTRPKQMCALSIQIRNQMMQFASFPLNVLVSNLAFPNIETKNVL